MIKNDPNLKGQQAGPAQYFDNSRFKLYPVHTRFTAITWFVADAMVWDDLMDAPAIIIQTDTKQQAVQAIMDLSEIKGNSKRHPQDRGGLSLNPTHDHQFTK